MKIRSDFVTNSSSSSFVVEICIDLNDGKSLKLQGHGGVPETGLIDYFFGNADLCVSPRELGRADSVEDMIRLLQKGILDDGEPFFVNESRYGERRRCDSTYFLSMIREYVHDMSDIQRITIRGDEDNRSDYYYNTYSYTPQDDQYVCRVRGEDFDKDGSSGGRVSFRDEYAAKDVDYIHYGNGQTITMQGYAIQKGKEAKAKLRAEMTSGTVEILLGSAEPSPERSQRYARSVSQPPEALVFAKKVFVHTSCTDGDMIDRFVYAYGGEIRSSTAQNTDYLIVGNDIDHLTNKVSKAVDLNRSGKSIQAMTEGEFWAMAQAFRDTYGTPEEARGPGGEVVLSDDVTAIDENAMFGKKVLFNAEALTGITIPESVKEIAPGAFRDAKMLTTIVAPTFPVSFFKENKLIIPALMGYLKNTELYQDAEIVAEYNKNLSSSFKKLRPQLFAADLVKALEIMADLKKITAKNVDADYLQPAQEANATACVAFLTAWKAATPMTEKKTKTTKVKEKDPFNATDMKKIWSCKKLEDGTLELTSYKGTETEITVPPRIGKASVTKIGAECFSPGKSAIKNGTERKAIKSITIPDGVTVIGYGAFSGCENLTSIHIPDSVTTIAGSAFNACRGLADADGWIMMKGILLKYIGSSREVVIPEGVSTIGDSAFSECKNLTSINIPDSVTAIGNDAFYGCESLTSINIPAGITTVESGTFYKCTKLASMTLPKSVTAICSGNFFGGAFGCCRSLTSIIIPDSVTTIGDYAFSECENLTSIDLPDSVTAIGNDAFYRCKNLANIHIPDSVTSIHPCAFSGCSALVNKIADDEGFAVINGILVGYTGPGGDVILPAGITAIGDHAFYGCESLTSINIPDRVTTIGSYAFYGCESLTSINIPDRVTTIGNDAFYGCKSLTSINIPDSVTTIESWAFAFCRSLTSINIPESVTSIEWSVCFACSSLTSINIPASVTSIGYSAFDGCSSLTNITIPDSVTSVEKDAFKECKNLTIHGVVGSCAEAYAKKNQIPFVIL